MTDEQDGKKCPGCKRDLIVEEKCTFYGDWYCVCAECDEVIDFDPPSTDPIDMTEFRLGRA